MGCLHVFQRHEWNKWTVIEQFVMRAPRVINGVETDKRVVIGFGLYQARDCKRCGRHQVECKTAA